jgi:catechol 2,3-dioxygenase-like lactoylglutathione lyase family enzyme
MPRLVGINHVALEVGDIEEAVAFYRSLFEIARVDYEGSSMAFLDMGDQFIALSSGRTAGPDSARHFGLVVDDKEAVRSTLADAGIETVGGVGLNFRDPWGNLLQIVDYRDIQFTKAPQVLAGMGLTGLEKRESALAELREKGLDQP